MRSSAHLEIPSGRHADTVVAEFFAQTDSCWSQVQAASLCQRLGLLKQDAACSEDLELVDLQHPGLDRAERRVILEAGRSTLGAGIKSCILTPASWKRRTEPGTRPNLCIWIFQTFSLRVGPTHA